MVELIYFHHKTSLVTEFEKAKEVEHPEKTEADSTFVEKLEDGFKI